MFTRFQIKLLAWFVTGGLFTFPAILTATPSFLNANSFPIQVSLSHIGPFHKNYLKTFEVDTHWSNLSSNKVYVEIEITIYDKDSREQQGEEDGKDDKLMTLYQTFNIPAQVGRWNKTFQITVIGDQLNKGFDNLEEGSSLELYMDSQITLIKFLPEE